MNRAELRDHLARLVSRHEDATLGDIPLGALIEEVLAVLRRNRLRLPHELALLIKALAMNEGMGARLDPDFRLGDVLAHYAERLIGAEISPAALARRYKEAGLQAAELAIELPEQLHRVLNAIDREGLQLLPATQLEQLIARNERQTNRLVTAMIGAAVIQGWPWCGPPDARRGDLRSRAARGRVVRNRPLEAATVARPLRQPLRAPAAERPR